MMPIYGLYTTENRYRLLSNILPRLMYNISQVNLNKSCLMPGIVTIASKINENKTTIRTARVKKVRGYRQHQTVLNQKIKGTGFSPYADNQLKNELQKFQDEFVTMPIIRLMIGLDHNDLNTTNVD